MPILRVPSTSMEIYVQNTRNAASDSGGFLSSVLGKTKNLLGVSGSAIPTPVAGPPSAPAAVSTPPAPPAQPEQFLQTAPNVQVMPVISGVFGAPGSQIVSLEQGLSLADYVTLDMEWMGYDSGEQDFSGVGGEEHLYLDFTKVVGGEVVDTFETKIQQPPTTETLQMIFDFVGSLPILGNRYGEFTRDDLESVLGRADVAWPSAWVDFTEIARKARGETYTPSLWDLMRDSGLRDLLRDSSLSHGAGTRRVAWMMAYLYEDLKQRRQLTTVGDKNRFVRSWNRFEPTPGIAQAFLKRLTPDVARRFPPARTKQVIGTKLQGVPSPLDDAADDYKHQVVLDGLAIDHPCDQVILVNDDHTRTHLTYGPETHVDESRRIITLNTVASLRSYVTVHYRSFRGSTFDVGAVKVRGGVIESTFSSLVHTEGGPALRDIMGIPLYSLEVAPSYDSMLEAVKVFAEGLPVVIMSDRWQSHTEMHEPLGSLLLANTWVDLAELAGRSHRDWRNVVTRKPKTLLDVHGIASSEEAPAVKTAWALSRLFEEIRQKEKRTTLEDYNRFVGSWEGQEPLSYKDPFARVAKSDFARDWAGKNVAFAGKTTLIRKEELEEALAQAGAEVGRLSNKSEALVWGGTKNPEDVKPYELTATVKKALSDKKDKGRVLAVFSEAEALRALGLAGQKVPPVVSPPMPIQAPIASTPESPVTPKLDMFASSKPKLDMFFGTAAPKPEPATPTLSMFSNPPAVAKPSTFSPSQGEPKDEPPVKPKMPWD